MLGALSGDHVMTAAEVAEATGLSSNAVETRLNELVKRGDVSKTTGGYQLSAPDSRAEPEPPGTA